MKSHRPYLIVACCLLLASIAVVTGCDSTAEAPPVDPDAGQADADAAEPDDAGEQDADTDPPAPAVLDVTPDHITFEGVEIDATETAQITVNNQGEADLTIEAIDLEIDDAPNHDLVLSEDSPDLPTVVESDRLIDYFVEYTPREAGSTTGEIVVHSDAEDDAEAAIRIETVSAYPELEAPNRITFDPVDPGESDTIGELVVANRGIAPLVVEDVYVDPDSRDDHAFSATVLGPAGEVEFPADRDRHAFWYLSVDFHPQDDTLKRAEIVIESNDPANETHVIEVSGNHSQPCLNTTGNLDFGEIADGDQRTDSITLLNCSQVADLEVTDIEIADDAGGVFEFVGDIDDPVQLEPIETYDIDIQATMTTDQQVVGLLTMTSDDPELDYLELQLRARPE